MNPDNIVSFCKLCGALPLRPRARGPGLSRQDRNAGG
jgi:hypothetical protein